MSAVEVNDSDGKLVGYARVSTSEQRLNLQLHALEEAGVSAMNIFTDKMSGGSRKRPGLTRLLQYLNEGDTLVVWRLDRLARSLSDLIGLMEELKKRGVKFRSLTEAINLDTASGSLVVHVLAAISEFERQVTSERISAGMQTRKAEGKAVGAQPKLYGPALTYAKKRRKAGIPAPQVAEELMAKFRVKVSPRTIYHRIKLGMDEKG